MALPLLELQIFCNGDTQHEPRAEALMLFEREESWAEAALGLGGFGTYGYLFDLFRWKDGFGTYGYLFDLSR